MNDRGVQPYLWWMKITLIVMMLVALCAVRLVLRKWFTLVRLGWRRWRRSKTTRGEHVVRYDEDDESGPPTAWEGGAFTGPVVAGGGFGDPYKLA